MRIVVRGETAVERIALLTRRVPLPAVQSLAGAALPGVLGATVRLGLLEELDAAPATPQRLAATLALRPDTTGLLLDALHALGYVRRRRGGRYTPTRSARRWLLPNSRRSVRSYLLSHDTYTEWWRGLPQFARGSPLEDHHSAAADDPYWQAYIRGQFELARYSAPELTAAMRVPPGARRVLDVGGGHGWFAAQLCRRHPELRGTVLDLPGSAAVGRNLAEQEGFADVVAYREGDARTAEFGDGWDVVLCFNLLHHLPAAQVPPLLSRLHAALRPGGTLAVLDLFASTTASRADATAACLGLLFHLSSGAGLHSTGQLRSWLGESGFVDVSESTLRHIPGQLLIQASAGTPVDPVVAGEHQASTAPRPPADHPRVATGTTTPAGPRGGRRRRRG